MAYLHCHNCDFSQDDFWHEGYNPVTCFQDDLEDLLTGDLDATMETDSSWLEEIGWKAAPEAFTKRESILYHLEKQLAARIRGMVYRTEAEFRKNNPEMKCPECGQIGVLDID